METPPPQPVPAALPADEAMDVASVSAVAMDVPLEAAPGPSVDELARKRKAEQAEAESKKRSRRMFGLLQGTLNKAKEETGKMTGATKQRQELEQRLALKLSRERDVMDLQRTKAREGKDAKADVSRKEDELSIADSIYRTRHDVKLKLAGFLCTTFAAPPAASSSHLVEPAFLPNLPHATHITGDAVRRPLYFLPYRLLRSQEDTINEQLAAAKAAIAKERDEWALVKASKTEDLADSRQRRDAVVSEVEQAQREVRQHQRQEKEAQQEQRKAKAAVDAERDVTMSEAVVEETVGETAAPTAEATPVVVSIAGAAGLSASREPAAPVAGEAEAALAPPVADGAAPVAGEADEDAKMEGEEEAIEY